MMVLLSAPLCVSQHLGVHLQMCVCACGQHMVDNTDRPLHVCVSRSRVALGLFSRTAGTQLDFETTRSALIIYLFY